MYAATCPLLCPFRASPLGARPASPELDLRNLLGLLGNCEGLLHLGVGIEPGRDPAARDRAERGVIGLHPVDVVLARDRDAVLGALELRLQRQEILVRLQVRIILAHRQQPPERAAERRLALAVSENY